MALAEQPATWRYGYELCQELGIRAGSMYPILMRLTDRGEWALTILAAVVFCAIWVGGGRRQ